MKKYLMSAFAILVGFLFSCSAAASPVNSQLSSVPSEQSNAQVSADSSADSQSSNIPSKPSITQESVDSSQVSQSGLQSSATSLKALTSSSQHSLNSSSLITSSQTISSYEKSALSEANIYQGNDVKLSIKSPATIDTKTKVITLTIENQSDNEYGCGEEFFLEIYQNSEWLYVPMSSHVFGTVLLMLGPHTKSDYDAYVQTYYSNLKPGKYRILKELLVKQLNGSYSNIGEMTVEFEMN